MSSHCFAAMSLPPATLHEVTEWLRSLERAPASPPAVPLLEDVEHYGRLYLGSYAKDVAMGFQGTPEFIARWFNWAVNTSVITRGSSLNWLYCERGPLAYVCAKSREVVRAGLARQFAWDIVTNREVPVTVVRDPETEEVETLWDEEVVRAMADQRAADFMRDHITMGSSVFSRSHSVAPVFEVVGPGRAERAWIGEAA